jgi:hypothetical protein
LPVPSTRSLRNSARYVAEHAHAHVGGVRDHEPGLQRLADHLPNDTCATALIDRTIEGDNYRHRDAETDKKSRRAKK